MLRCVGPSVCHSPGDRAASTVTDENDRCRQRVDDCDHGVNVVAIKHLGDTFTHPGPDTVLTPGSLVLVAGYVRNVERFALLE